MEKFVLNESDFEGNKLYGDLYLENSKIKFSGKNNIIFIDGQLKLIDSTIEFRGDNSLIFIGETDDIITLDVKIYNNSTLCIGKDVWINKGIKIVISEETNVFFGSDCLISYDTCIRTGDPHLIYDCASKKRINKSKSLYVGDHVWIGQHVMLLKGAMVGSGTIIGAMSLLSGKKYESNCVYAGNPVRKKKENVFFLKNDCHRFMEEESNKFSEYNSDEFIYEHKDKGKLLFEEIEDNLNKLKVDERVNYLKNIFNNIDKNRFSI